MFGIVAEVAELIQLQFPNVAIPVVVKHHQLSLVVPGTGTKFMRRFELIQMLLFAFGRCDTFVQFYVPRLTRLLVRLFPLFFSLIHFLNTQPTATMEEDMAPATPPVKAPIEMQVEIKAAIDAGPDVFVNKHPL